MTLHVQCPAWYNEMMTWIACFGTLLCIFLAGKKNILAWPIGIAAQLLWVWFSLHVGDLGLLSLNIVVTGLYACNWYTWRKQ